MQRSYGFVALFDSNYKKDRYNPNIFFIKSLLNEINYEYGSHIKYEDFEFNHFVDYGHSISLKMYA